MAEEKELPTKSLGWTDQRGGRETGKTNQGSPGRERCKEKRVDHQEVLQKAQQESGPKKAIPLGNSCGGGY